MKIVAMVVFHLTLLVSAAPDLVKDDWRHDLLKEEGFEMTEEALRRALAEFEGPPEGLEEAYQGLGAEEFKRREEAQRKLLRGGRGTLDFLDGVERSPNPEVRQRVTEIRKQLTSPRSSGRKNAVRHAVRALLSQRDKEASDTGGLFYEWFGEDRKTIGKQYRILEFESTSERGGQVADGRLVLHGDGGVDGDQRVVLRSEAWPGTKSYGKSFRVSAKTGGKPGGMGGWHLGITIGKVRVLYHPGLEGGGFRFEEVGKMPYLTQNEMMGFTPTTETMQWMSVEVHRLGDGSVKLEVTIEQGESGPGRFQRSLTVDAKVIGDLNRVSFDRSGRVGGDAIFDDLTVDLRVP